MESATQHSATCPQLIETGETTKPPFSQIFITLTQEKYVQFKWDANYWKGQYNQVKQKNEDLKLELESAHARIRDLKQRLYGKKTEKGVSKRDEPGMQNRADTPRSRGQQKGSKGHGRTLRPDLPIIEEEHDIAAEDKLCPVCTKPYNLLSRTEDSGIVEIKVKSYIRRVIRKMYVQGCQCEGVTGLITAPPAPRLIPKSGIGISVWREVLLNKFLFSRALNNLCIDYTLRGLCIAPGTLTGGLQKIAPLFEPLVNELVKKQLTEDLFHNDETGWKVFETIEGKTGYRWWLWVTQSRSVVYYTLAPSRSGDIPIEYFSGLDKHLDQVIVVCDRYKGYIRLARVIPQIILAFCWAHVRRDFLDAARSYPKLEAWMLDWVELIGELYNLNKQRLKEWDEIEDLENQSQDFKKHHQALEQATQRMKERYEHLLEKEKENKNLQHIQCKVLNSLNNHWKGLTVFLINPQVPMDNNIAERRMRNPGMGRKNYYGSGSQWSARLAAMMFSLFQTILLWGFNPHHWLHGYLDAWMPVRTMVDSLHQTSARLFPG
jgi:transposase